MKRLPGIPLRFMGFTGIECLLLVTTVTVVSISGCASTDESFPDIVGASAKSDVRPCADYASRYSYSGTPYHVKVPETGKVTTRHEGIDFCKDAGSEVIAPANGTVVQIVQDNPYRGGRVTLRTGIDYNDPAKAQKLHLDLLHITPREGLKIGDPVKAGQVVGHVQPPGKPEIGPRSHVHLSAGPTPRTWMVHTDPNRYWQKGPGIVSCLDPSKPPGDLQVVAPVKC